MGGGKEDEQAKGGEEEKIGTVRTQAQVQVLGQAYSTKSRVSTRRQMRLWWWWREGMVEGEVSDIKSCACWAGLGNKRHCPRRAPTIPTTSLRLPPPQLPSSLLLPPALPCHISHKQQKLDPSSHLRAGTGSGRVDILLGPHNFQQTQTGSSEEEPRVG